jgi:uncharacterized protein YjlB
MPLKDQIKNVARKLTERRPDETALDAMLESGRKPALRRFKDDGIVPNHPHFPLIIYRKAVRFNRGFAPAVIIDALFARNGWGRSWRDTVYDFVHYHSRVHEVLGVARGNALLECGGIRGAKVKVRAGDVLVIPAGTGHRLLEASRNFLVVGAYPPDGAYDECTDTRDREQAIGRIAKVKRPKRDPVFGRDGALHDAWQR